MSRALVPGITRAVARLAAPRRRVLAAAAVCLLSGTAVVVAASSSSGQDAGGHPRAAARTTAAAASGGAVPGRAPAVACPDQSAVSLPAPPVGTATHLFTRTTGDGIDLRAYQLPGAGVACAPAPETSGVLGVCGEGGVELEMSDTTAVGQGFLGPALTPLPVTTTPAHAGNAASAGGAGEAPGVQDTTTGAFGVTEGDPVWWVAAEDVPADVTTARVTFSDGSSDTMAPVGGAVALAHHMVTGAVASDPDTVRGTLQLLGSTGAVIATVTFPEAQTTPPPPGTGNSGAGNTGSGSSGTGNSGTGNSGTGNSGAGGTGNSGSGVGSVTEPPAFVSPPADVNGISPAIAYACPMMPVAPAGPGPRPAGTTGAGASGSGAGS